MVREATQRRCRCHGISGMCQFRSCWDQPPSFHVITSRLRDIYLFDSTKVELKNLGPPDMPDLYLSRVKRSDNYDHQSETRAFNLRATSELLPKPLVTNSQSSDIDPMRPRELVYLHNSPEYCEPQPSVAHPGTRGRACIPIPDNNLNTSKAAMAKNLKNRSRMNPSEKDVVRRNLDSAPGTCQLLCCNRGHSSELVLDLVDCNCRFKFCCRVECDYCLRQRAQHYCL